MSQKPQSSPAEPPVRVGMIGCGNISNAYLRACRRFPILEVAAVADLILERAQAKAQEHQVPKAYSVEELLADPEVEVVINLTVPKVHAEVSTRVLEAGKSVYSEKPLATERADGRALLELAERHKLRIGCAPDTFLGGGLQTCRKLVDDGWIGKPVAATAFMMSHGPESWHPDPEFFFQPGAGPLFDMAPYYLTALIQLLGPLKQVSGATTIGTPERTITSEPRYGQQVQVNTPTHVAGLLEFHSGAVATLITSFEVWASQVPRIEIYGTEGTLSVPDPNTFGGPVRIKRAGAEAWQEIPLTHGYTDNSRGLGTADMAQAARSGRAHRASGEMAFHVLDTMQSLLESAREERYIPLSSRCERPRPLPLGLIEGFLDH